MGGRGTPFYPDNHVKERKKKKQSVKRGPSTLFLQVSGRRGGGASPGEKNGEGKRKE